MNKNLLTLVRILTLLFGLDLLIVLGTGRYIVPGLGFESMHPVTSLFFLLLSLLLHNVLQKKWRSPLNLFLLIWLLFLSNFRWRGTGDCVGPSLQPFALLKNGNLYLDEYAGTFMNEPADNLFGAYRRNGRLLVQFPSAAGIMLTPFYLVSGLAGVQPTDLLIHQLQKIGASCMVAVSALMLFLLLREFLEQRWAVLL